MLIFSCLYHAPNAAPSMVKIAQGVTLTAVLVGVFFLRRVKAEEPLRTSGPLAALSSSSSRAASGANSSVGSNSSASASSKRRLATGNSKVDREGALIPPSCLTAVGEVVCVRRPVLVLFRR